MALFSKDPAPPAQGPARRDTPVPPSGATFIGANVTIEGTLGGSEAVVIEGTVRGEVKLTGDLRVGPKGKVEATVRARSVLVEGRVEGDLAADERVELVAGSSVDGNIKAPKIVVAEGAQFRGSVDMGSSRPVEGADAGSKTR
jgi:cytoskeletal protein CcmA (bactofilin family)